MLHLYYGSLLPPPYTLTYSNVYELYSLLTLLMDGDMHVVLCVTLTPPPSLIHEHTTIGNNNDLLTIACIHAVSPLPPSPTHEHSPLHINSQRVADNCSYTGVQ